jgi:hypothetical protein
MSVKFKKAEFAESVKELYLTEFPNPDRIGCPEPERLRDFAWRKDLERSGDIALHLIHCSPCCQQEEQYLDEYRKHVRRKNVSTALQLGAVAALLALSVPWVWHHLRPGGGSEHTGTSQSVQEKVTQSSGEYQEAHLRLNDPLLSQNSGNNPGDSDSLELVRGQLRVSIELPPDARMEPFDVRISSLDDRPLIQQRGQVVRDEKGNIQLRVTMNTAGLPAGQYSLGLHQGKLDWVTFPLRIN